MAKHTAQRGYFKLPTDDGDRWMHFSMNCYINLQELSDLDLTDWFKKLDESNEFEKGLMIYDLALAAILAYDQEENNDIDYNIYTVRNWVGTAVKDNPGLIEEMFEAMTKSLGK